MNFLSAAAIIVSCNEDDHTGLGRVGLNITLLEGGVAMMLVAIAGSRGAIRRPVGMRWLRVVGQCSYEIYLFHMFVVLGLMSLFKALQPPQAMIPLWYIGMLILSLGLGFGISRLYSEPLNQRLRLPDWFARVSSSKRPTTSSAQVDMQSGRQVETPVERADGGVG